MKLFKCPFCSARCLGVDSIISHGIYHHFLATYAERKFVMDETLEFYVIRIPDNLEEFNDMISAINLFRNEQPSTKSGILFDVEHSLAYVPYTNTTYPVQLMCYSPESCMLATVLHDHVSKTLEGIPDYFDGLYRRVKREVQHLNQGLAGGATSSWNL